MTRRKKVFLYTFVIGILTHAFRMTNTMICADTTNYFDTLSASWVTTLGRYILPVVEKVRGNYELPWLIGMISLIMIALSAALFTELFDLREEVSLMITAWIFCANPVVTSIFAFMYTSDGYMISLFFSILSAYLCIRKKGTGSIIFAGLSLMVSLGFYQAFLSVTIIIMLFWLFKMLLTPETPFKEIGKMIGRCLLTGIVGVTVYVVFMLLAWNVGDHHVTAYMGMNTVGKMGMAGMLQAFKDCYVDFARFYIVRWEVNCYNVMNVMMFLLTGIIWLMIVIKRKLWKTPVRVILTVVMFPILPFVCHIFEFTSSEVSYATTSMEYSLIMIYLLLLIMWREERENIHTGLFMNDSKDGNISLKINWSYAKKNYLWLFTVLLLLCISFHFTVIANRAYYNMENANTKMEMLLNRMVTRMEMTEGYREDMELAIYGSCFQDPEYVPAAPIMSGVVSNIFLSQSNEYVNMMNHYLSTSYGRAGFDEMKKIVRSEEFAQMEPWPSVNSVKIIDGIMVLYLSDTGMKQYLSEE